MRFPNWHCQTKIKGVKRCISHRTNSSCFTKAQGFHFSCWIILLAGRWDEDGEDEWHDFYLDLQSRKTEGWWRMFSSTFYADVWQRCSINKKGTKSNNHFTASWHSFQGKYQKILFFWRFLKVEVINETWQQE